MAGQSKRRNVQKEDSSDNESESGSYHGQTEIQADFEGRNLEPPDFDGVKQLLKQLFLKSHIDLSEMSDLLINQDGVGSALKQSSDDDDDDDDADEDMAEDNTNNVFGISSFVNITHNWETGCVKQLVELLKELSTKHGDEKTKQFISQHLNAKTKLGLLLNERFINIPAKISDPLLTSLVAELDQIKKKHKSYDFDYIFMICKMFKPKSSDDTSSIIYSNQEEEIFSRHAVVKFDFNVESQCDTGIGGKWSEGDTQMIPYRQILAFPGKQLGQIVEEVKHYVA